MGVSEDCYRRLTEVLQGYYISEKLNLVRSLCVEEVSSDAQMRLKAKLEGTTIA
jgi:hypothetical protein